MPQAVEEFLEVDEETKALSLPITTLSKSFAPGLSYVGGKDRWGTTHATVLTKRDDHHILLKRASSGVAPYRGTGELSCQPSGIATPSLTPSSSQRRSAAAASAVPRAGPNWAVSREVQAVLPAIPMPPGSGSRGHPALCLVFNMDPENLHEMNGDESSILVTPHEFSMALS
eukprot:s1628_g5.t1